MMPSTIWERVASWLACLPIRLAYRIIWLVALTGASTPRAVYQAMWDANLNLPRLPGGPRHER